VISRKKKKKKFISLDQKPKKRCGGSQCMTGFGEKRAKKDSPSIEKRPSGSGKVDRGRRL